MTVATIDRNDYGFKLRIKGHTGYRSYGEDIVCAAISGIFYAYGGYLAAFRDDKVVIHALESGFVDIDCSIECEELLRAVCFGLLLIEKAYPENLKVYSVFGEQFRSYFK